MNTETNKKKKKALILPQDLLIQILLRLPVKSLARFRCVSKLWLSLISDPHFAKLHFEFDSTRTQRLLIFSSDFSEIRSIDFNAPSLHDDSTSAVIKLNFPHPQPHDRVRIIGCCRGFILFDCYPNFYMWNPTTGFHKQIPLPPCYSSSHGSRYFSFLRGFGYDPSTDDYLIPLVSIDYEDRYTVNRVDIFSLKGNTWKELECLLSPYTIYNEYFIPVRGLLFNGAIHWIVNNSDRGKNVIVVFDLMERSFSEIDLPCGCDLDFSDLHVFGGCLSLCTTGFTGMQSRFVGRGRGWVTTEYTELGAVWVMEEYKVQSSWTKRDIVVAPDIENGSLTPVCCTKSGDIVGREGRSLVKFNYKGEVQEYRSYSYPKNEWDVVMYRESLLSLPNEN